MPETEKLVTESAWDDIVNCCQENDKNKKQPSINPQWRAVARNYTADNLYRGDRSLCEWDGYSIRQYPPGTGACGVQGCTRKSKSQSGKS